MGGVNAYNGGIRLTDAQLIHLQTKMGVRYLYDVMKTYYCQRSSCYKAFHRIKVPALEPCEMLYYFSTTTTPSTTLKVEVDNKSSVVYYKDTRNAEAALLFSSTSFTSPTGADDDHIKYTMVIPGKLSRAGGKGMYQVEKRIENPFIVSA